MAVCIRLATGIPEWAVPEELPGWTNLPATWAGSAGHRWGVGLDELLLLFPSAFVCRAQCLLLLPASWPDGTFLLRDAETRHGHHFDLARQCRGADLGHPLRAWGQ